MIDDLIKVWTANTVAFAVTLSDVHSVIQIVLGMAAITYTVIKIIKERKED